MTIKRIAITTGEPAGIGPDLTLALALEDWPCQLIAIGDPELLKDRAHQLGLDVSIALFDDNQTRTKHQPGTLLVAPLTLAAPCKAGQLDAANSNYVVKMLEIAGKGCQSGRFDAIMTAPVHKGVINDAGLLFSGHTEFFAALSGTERVVMMLATPGLRVALVTTHLPLQQVPAAITHESVLKTLQIVAGDLQKHFKIAQPRLLVCGLNPHAGEQGHLGFEEINTIIPALTSAKQAGIDAQGPFPADTLFQPRYLENADAVIAMYHDQGLPVLKYRGFGNAVNITLGLPFVRTSVDHGTALDLAGTGNIDTGSAKYALQVAIDLVA